MALKLSPENELSIFECVKSLGFEIGEFTFNSTDYDANYVDKDKMYIIKYNANNEYICELSKATLTKVSYYPFKNDNNLSLVKRSFINESPNVTIMDFYIQHIEGWLKEIRNQNELSEKLRNITNTTQEIEYDSVMPDYFDKENSIPIMKSNEKKSLFISYSSKDNDKIELIRMELENHSVFTAKIIASDREPLIPLAEKVKIGIEKAFVIIPILTSKSINTQWINQEIGYSTGKGIALKPIVEVQIMKKLKGFIHKELDLPFNFRADKDRSIEDENFIKAFRDLLKFLEGDKPLPEKSEFEKSLEEYDKIKSDEALLQEKLKFLDSVHGADAAFKVIQGMFLIIREKLKVLEGKKVHFNTSEGWGQTPHYTFTNSGLTCSILWNSLSGYSVKDAELIVEYLEGDFKGGQNSQKSLSVVYRQKYKFERRGDSEFGWVIHRDFYTTAQIVDAAFTWMMKELNKKSTLQA